MIESSSWTPSRRDEEIHKAAGNVQLRKYSQFFSNLSSKWWETSSSPSSNFEYIFEGPIRLIHHQKLNENILSLVETENKNLSKVLGSIAGTCREIRLLKNEFTNYYTKLFANGEEELEENKQNNYSELYNDLQNLSLYINRINTIINLSIKQLSSLTNTTNEIYLPLFIENIIDLFLILLIIDEIIYANPDIADNFKKYRLQVRSVMHNPGKFSIDEKKLLTFDKILKDLEQQLLKKTVFLNAIENIMNLKKTTIMNDHIQSYLKNLLTDIEMKINNLFMINKSIIRINIGIVLSGKLFGTYDKKLAKKINDIGKKIFSVSLIANILFIPCKFLSDLLPRDFSSPVNLQIGEKLLTIRLQKLPIISQNLVQRAINWCIESNNLLSGDDFQISEIKKQYCHLKNFIYLLMEIDEQVIMITNLHGTLGKPMSRITVQIICRLIEVEKNLETTLYRMGCAVVQAQSRGLQYLSYEILTLLDSARKGLIQKDHGYSREKLDALSMMNLSMKLISGGDSADRRLLARCTLSMSRQLSDTFRDDEAIKLKQKLNDYDTIADFYPTIKELCNYSVLLHHQNMLPAYFSSITESDQDISHVINLLAAFNTAIINQGISKFTNKRINELKLSIEKNILEPGCREIETSLRLHVHEHLKIDTINPFKIGTKNSLRIVNSLPLKINNNMINTKHFIENYLDDIFYNLTTIALHDWKTYRTMYAIGNYKLNIKTIENHLPTQTIEQGLDSLDIMRNINIFVSKYLYNLNTQTFIEHKSLNKHLNTIGIRHIGNSIRTHGNGIINTTINFIYQYLKIKLHIFSQFLYDEHIKSRLLKDIKYIKKQRDNDDTVPYTYDRAEKFQKAIRKLGMTNDNLSYLDQFRQLITHIGNSLGYVRLIRSGCLHACSNAISFLPEINKSINIENLCLNLNYNDNLIMSAKKIDDDIDDLVKNFTEGIQYFKLLINVFSSSFRDSKNHHLQQFYAIIPPLTLSFIDNAISNKEKIFKKNKDGAAFTDDGFAMGIAYINSLLNQNNEFDSLQWFETVNKHLYNEKKIAEFSNEGEDEKLKQTRALTLKRLAERTAEFQLLYYSLSGARVFFKQNDS